MRATLSPVFTSGRMKLMSDSLEEAATLLVAEIGRDVQGHNSIEFQKTFQYTFQEVVMGLKSL